MSTEQPRNVGDTPTKRDVTLRDDSTERVWVEWYSPPGGSFTSIFSEQDGDELRIFSADANELGRLLAALRDEIAPDANRSMVRDLGFERAWLERSDGFVTLVVESAAGRRMLVLDEAEVKKLIDAVERAEDELTGTEGDAHV